MVQFDWDDIVIDCGANYADLWINLSHRIKPKNYITYEPGPQEHEVIKINAPFGTHNKVALSDRIGTTEIFMNSQNADSSLIEPETYSHIIETPVSTIDAESDRNRIKTIKLLKLEAEGNEPEVLAGAEKTIPNIEYIALDGSPERGKKKEETFSTIANMLLKQNFTLIQVNLKLGRALFKNNIFNS